MRNSKGTFLHWNFSWSLLASLVAATSQWLIIALLARSFPSGILGQYTYALAVVAPIVLFGQMGLRLIQTADQRGEYSLLDFYAARAIGTLASAVLFAIYLLVDPVTGSSAALVVTIALARFVEGFGDIAHGQFLQAERADLQAQSLIWRSVLQFSAVVAVAVLYKDVMLLGLGLLLSSLLTVLIFDIPRSRTLVRLSSGQHARSLGRLVASVARGTAILRRALPLGVMGVLGALYQNIPRYEIGLRLGVEAVGFFSAVFYFTYVGYIVVSAIGAAVSPRISRAFASGSQDYRSLVVAVTMAAAAIGLVGVALAVGCGDWILAVIYGADYAQFQSLLVWVLISSVFWYGATALSFCAIAAGRFRGQGAAHLLAAVVTWTGSKYLVGNFGISGGAMALTGGVFALFLVELWLVWKVLHGLPPARPASRLQS